jgi:hypothetical protein
LHALPDVEVDDGWLFAVEDLLLEADFPDGPRHCLNLASAKSLER